MNLKYTAKDFDSFFNELKTKAQELFPDWTDFSRSNVGTIFLELFALLGDQLSYYSNAHMREAFLPSVSRRRNMIKILKRMNYELGDRQSASVDLKFEFDGGGSHSQDVTIPQYYQVSTGGGDIFELVDDLVITAGETEGIISAYNRVTIDEDASFDGTVEQELYLTQSNFLEVVEVYIEGLLWTEVTDLLDSGPEDRHFKMEFDNDLNAVMLFGNGLYGKLPDGNGVVTYRYGGGVAANSIQPGQISTLSEDILDALSNPVQMVVTNEESPSGGQDEESLDSARRLAPRAVRVQQSTVSRDDYEGNSENVEGVARALALGKQDDPGVAAGSVYVRIVPDGGGIPSNELREEVKRQLFEVKPVMMSSEVFVQNPTYKLITISGDIIKKEQFEDSAVKAAVDAALIQYFNYDNIDENNEYTVDFGFYKPILYLSEIITVIQNATISGLGCVKNVTLTAPGSDVSIGLVEIEELDSLAGLVVV